MAGSGPEACNEYLRLRRPGQFPKVKEGESLPGLDERFKGLEDT